MACEPEVHGRLRRGIGCVTVIPAALIGVSGLTDGVGPKGWVGLSEFMGWAAICLAASRVIAWLLVPASLSGVRRYASLTITLLTVGAFTYLPHWLGLYAPMSAKIFFTSSLQVVGAMAAGAFVVCIIYFLRRGRRS
jgi:hypothetical protein